MLGFLLAMGLAVADPFPVDMGLTRGLQEQTRNFGLEYEVVVVVPPSWGDRGVVNAETHVRGKYLAVAVSPILLEDMDRDGLYSMFAHELAHTLNHCGPTYRDDKEKLACEHAADVQAARWVGRRSVLRGLCQLMESSFRWRYGTDVSPLMDRIRLLHQRKDIQ
jgi:hypothetical protein